MYKINRSIFLGLIALFFLNGCKADIPFLSRIKRAKAIGMVNCDPYGKGHNDTCVVYSNNERNLIIYDASHRALVAGPMKFGELRVPVGPATNQIATVKGAPNDFPYFFALERVDKKIFVVRSFYNADKSVKSFMRPKSISLSDKPGQMVSYLEGNDVIILVTYPDKKQLEVIWFDKSSSDFTSVNRAQHDLLVKGSHIALSDDTRFAIVTSKFGTPFKKIDLTVPNLKTTSGAGVVTDSVVTSFRGGEIQMASRNFGDGQKDYALVINHNRDRVALINFSDNRREAILDSYRFINAIYFPSSSAETCCDGKSNWFLYADQDGDLYYVVIEKSGGRIQLKEQKPVELGSASAINASNISVSQIVGGPVRRDQAEESVTKDCARMIFIATDFAKSKSIITDEIEILGGEIDGQAAVCEGKESPQPLGVKVSK